MKHKYYHDALTFFLTHYDLRRKDFPRVKHLTWMSPRCYKESRNGSFDFADHQCPDLTWVILKKHLGHYLWNEKTIAHPIQKYYAVVFWGAQWLSLYSGVPATLLWERLSAHHEDCAQRLLWLYDSVNLATTERVLQSLQRDWKEDKTLNLQWLAPATMPV